MAASPNGDDQRAPAPAPFRAVVKDGKEELVLPPGYRFAPTEVEVINFLKRKILGKKPRVEIIPTIDVYKYNPYQMPLEEFKYGQEWEWYFYTTRPEGDEFVVKDGFWASLMNREIKHDGQVIGYKQIIPFVCGVQPNVMPSNWVIYEYRINPDSFQATDDIKEKIKTFVVCKVTVVDKALEKALQHASSLMSTLGSTGVLGISVDENGEIDVIDVIPVENSTDANNDNNGDNE